MQPLVSILMPVFNAERYLREAIESILNQSYNNLEFLIINDGSTDNSEAIILSYPDDRINYHKNKENLGIIATLNKGIRLVKGKYIVRMDADDIALPNRVKLQIDLMEQKSWIGICGTWVQTFKGEKKIAVRKSFSSHEAIKGGLLLGSALQHPTVVIRKSILDTLKIKYAPLYLHAEDYELWTRLIFNTQFYNLPKILLKYRIHDENISTLNSAKQKQMTNHIKLSYYEKILNRSINKEEKAAILESWESPNAIKGLFSLTEIILAKKTLLKKQGIEVFYCCFFLDKILALSTDKKKYGLTLKQVFPFLFYSFKGMKTKMRILIKLL